MMNLVITFQKIKCCFNNNIVKALCIAKWGHTFKDFIIIIKTLFYLLKINKGTTRKYFCNSNFVTHFYRHIYILVSR